MGICFAVAAGGRALGSIEVEQGEVLYLALEDNVRRLKSRMQKVLSAERSHPKGLENLHLRTEWERIDEGGLPRLREWMKTHPKTQLIVIDTLEKIRPRRKGNGSVYGDDYNVCESLKAFADVYGVAVVIVHHTRKGNGTAYDPVEAVSGSYGLTGGVDNVLTLKRERGRGDASLFVTGRDVDEQDLALKWDAELCLWNILGDADEHRMSSQRACIISVLREGEPLTPKQLTERTGLKSDNLRQFLHQMRKLGQVHEENGKYTIGVPSINANTPNDANAPHVANGQSRSQQSAPTEPKEHGLGTNPPNHAHVRAHRQPATPDEEQSVRNASVVSHISGVSAQQQTSAPHGESVAPSPRPNASTLLDSIGQSRQSHPKRKTARTNRADSEPYRVLDREEITASDGSPVRDSVSKSPLPAREVFEI